MEIRAKSSYLRMGPRKLRLVADQIRGLEAVRALALLQQSGKKGSRELAETLRQAISNAGSNFHLATDDLKIKKVEVNGGPIYKRFRAVSRGMAHSIKKRTSHIHLVLEGGSQNGTKS